jgi:hypothetical protein
VGIVACYAATIANFRPPTRRSCCTGDLWFIDMFRKLEMRSSSENQPWSRLLGHRVLSLRDNMVCQLQTSKASLLQNTHPATILATQTCRETCIHHQELEPVQGKLGVRMMHFIDSSISRTSLSSAFLPLLRAFQTCVASIVLANGIFVSDLKLLTLACLFLFHSRAAWR